MGKLHLRNDIWSSDYDSSEGYESIDLLSSNKSHYFDLSKFFYDNHQLVSFAFLLNERVIVHFVSHKHFFVEVLDNLIEETDHFCRKVYKLVIQVNIVLFQMQRIYWKYARL